MRARLVAVMLAGALAAPVGAQQAPFAGFDAYVNQAMKDWRVPGVAIAIVRGDSVVLAKGYGVRTVGKPDPVTPNTMFAIGSATKAFTAMGVAMLVDAGKVRWDDPVQRHLPWFQMSDPYLSHELTVRDILTHRSGLARGDLVWYANDLPRDEVVRRVRFLRPTWGLRTTFGYQNIMFLTAGQVAAAASGRSWDDLVRERILGPLGMTSTNTSVAALRTMADVATPYVLLRDTVLQAVPYHNIDDAGPAGAINSTALDMAKWVRFQLDSGKVNGKALVSAGNFVETHTPQTVIRVSPQARAMNPFTHFSSYGFGWFLEDYRGRELVHHGGNIDGMSALVAMLPEERVGIVVLTNMNSTPLPMILARRAFDLYLQAPPRDWSAEVRTARAGAVAQGKVALRKKLESRVANTAPSLPLAKYAGTYADSLFGDATVAVRDGKLALAYGTLTGPLEHWHYDTFRWRSSAPGGLEEDNVQLFTFVLDAAGKVAELRAEAEPGSNAEEIPAWKRAPDKADTVARVALAPAELPKYAGTFESKAPALAVEVQLIDGALKLTVPGQPAYTLVPDSPTRFKLTGAGIPAGFFLDYAFDGRKVQSVTLVQPSPRPTLTLQPKM